MLCRRRQPPDGGNGDTGDSDEDGGAPPPPGGGGGDEFWGDGAGDGDSSSSGNASMLWRLLCIASMLQVSSRIAALVPYLTRCGIGLSWRHPATMHLGWALLY